MPRAKRYIVPGHTYHVTHRCHDREFLLRFQKDRTAYCRLLREHELNSPISLFNYCVTSNHVHLLRRSGRVMLALTAPFRPRKVTLDPGILPSSFHKLLLL